MQKSDIDSPDVSKEAKSLLNNDIGFLYKHFMQTFFPYRKSTKTTFERKNGYCSLTLISSSEELGLPYGMIPRILMIWLVSKAIKKQSNQIFLPNSLSSFIGELGLRRNGGVRGDITRLKEQFIKLIHTAFSIKFNDSETYQVLNLFIIEEAHLWWDQSNNKNDFDAYIKLSEGFYREIKQNCVPINLEIIHQLSHSCLAIDIYMWLTFRMGYIKNRTFIPWESLKAQFGFEYSQTTKGMYNFKTEFNTQLAKVCSLYKEAKIFPSDNKKGLMLYPSPTSVPRNVVKLFPKEIIEEPKLVSKMLVAKDNDGNELHSIIMNEFGLSAKLAQKLTENKTSVQVEQSIASVREIINNGKAINIKALIRKALEEEWQPKTIVVNNSDVRTNSKSPPDEQEITNPEWKIVRANIKNILGEATFNSWITKINLLSFEGEIVNLIVPSKFIKGYIENKYQDVILMAWKQVNSAIKAVQINSL